MRLLLRALAACLSPRRVVGRARPRRGVPWGASIALLAVVVGVLTRSSGDDVASEKDGRAILGRFWFDQLPTSSRDAVHVWLWLGGGIGIHEAGSSYRFSVDLFDFERAGRRLDMKYFQDGKRVETAFRVERCDDRPPFDLCLLFDQAPGEGPKKLYGFDDEDDLGAHVPWAPQARRAAEELARAPRP